MRRPRPKVRKKKNVVTIVLVDDDSTGSTSECESIKEESIKEETGSDDEWFQLVPANRRKRKDLPKVKPTKTVRPTKKILKSPNMKSPKQEDADFGGNPYLAKESVKPFLWMGNPYLASGSEEIIAASG